LDVFGSLVKPPFPGAVITDLSHFATNFAWSIRSKCRLLNDRGCHADGLDRVLGYSISLRPQKPRRAEVARTIGGSRVASRLHQ
jgi:hypothetical protein